MRFQRKGIHTSCTPLSGDNGYFVLIAKCERVAFDIVFHFVFRFLLQCEGLPPRGKLSRHLGTRFVGSGIVNHSPFTDTVEWNSSARVSYGLSQQEDSASRPTKGGQCLGLTTMQMS
ncbi:hypothetical protein CEXT_697391 [Caerostris extrusa]|uniref:Uncharacterized protein n=1 Tax=Caerostris extrusa TaxID=172846 RepID=A0AAV4SYJ3_CAEEX|nr:hypothetical protein CEXT_697391 [Caerostris extrusa]